jgi:hypothetical protein
MRDTKEKLGMIAAWALLLITVVPIEGSIDFQRGCPRYTIPKRLVPVSTRRTHPVREQNTKRLTPVAIAIARPRELDALLHATL